MSLTKLQLQGNAQLPPAQLPPTERRRTKSTQSLLQSRHRSRRRSRSQSRVQGRIRIRGQTRSRSLLRSSAKRTQSLLQSRHRSRRRSRSQSRVQGRIRIRGQTRSRSLLRSSAKRDERQQCKQQAEKARKDREQQLEQERINSEQQIERSKKDAERAEKTEKAKKGREKAREKHRRKERKQCEQLEQHEQQPEKECINSEQQLEEDGKKQERATTANRAEYKRERAKERLAEEKADPFGVVPKSYTRNKEGKSKGKGKDKSGGNATASTAPVENTSEETAPTATAAAPPAVSSPPTASEPASPAVSSPPAASEPAPSREAIKLIKDQKIRDAQNTRRTNKVKAIAKKAERERQLEKKKRRGLFRATQDESSESEDEEVVGQDLEIDMDKVMDKLPDVQSVRGGYHIAPEEIPCTTRLLKAVKGGLTNAKIDQNDRTVTVKFPLAFMKSLYNRMDNIDLYLSTRKEYFEKVMKNIDQGAVTSRGSARSFEDHIYKFLKNKYIEENKKRQNAYNDELDLLKRSRGEHCENEVYLNDTSEDKVVFIPPSKSFKSNLLRLVRDLEFFILNISTKGIILSPQEAEIQLEPITKAAKIALAAQKVDEVNEESEVDEVDEGGRGGRGRRGY